MKFSNDFWVVYDTAQKHLSNNPEYSQLESDIIETLEQFEDQAMLERLTNALQMQSTLLAHAIYLTAKRQVRRQSCD